MVIAAVIRCFVRTPDMFWMMILAQAINAAGGPPVMSLPPKVNRFTLFSI